MLIGISTFLHCQIRWRATIHQAAPGVRSDLMRMPLVVPSKPQRCTVEFLTPPAVFAPMLRAVAAQQNAIRHGDVFARGVASRHAMTSSGGAMLSSPTS